MPAGFCVAGCGATGVYRLATIKTSSDSAKAAVQTAEGLKSRCMLEFAGPYALRQSTNVNWPGILLPFSFLQRARGAHLNIIRPNWKLPNQKGFRFSRPGIDIEVWSSRS